MVSKSTSRERRLNYLTNTRDLANIAIGFRILSDIGDIDNFSSLRKMMQHSPSASYPVLPEAFKFTRIIDTQGVAVKIKKRHIKGKR